MSQGFYSDQTVTPLTTAYQQFLWPFEGKNILLHNDDTTNSIIVSLDGTHTLATVLKGESFQFQLTNDETNVLFLKATPAAALYRITIIG